MLANIKNEMKKGCVVGIFLLVMFIILVILLRHDINKKIKSDFGPTYKTFQLDTDVEGKLICIEKYSADLTSVFYTVDFKLIKEASDTFEFGKGVYNDKEWIKNIKIIEIDDWYVLPTMDNDYAKILLINQSTKHSQEYFFSPHELRYDSLWFSLNKEIPTSTYKGGSRIDSISENKIYVEYDYCLGSFYDSITYVCQSIEYEINPNMGTLSSKKVLPVSMKKDLPTNK